MSASEELTGQPPGGRTRRRPARRSEPAAPASGRDWSEAQAPASESCAAFDDGRPSMPPYIDYTRRRNVELARVPRKTDV